MRVNKSASKTVIVLSPGSGTCPKLLIGSYKVVIKDDYHGAVKIGNTLLKRASSL